MARPEGSTARGTGPQEPLPFLLPGSRVGRYRIEQRLGVGATSEVYLATDESLGRRAAIKVLSSKLINYSTITQSFLREDSD